MECFEVGAVQVAAAGFVGELIGPVGSPAKQIDEEVEQTGGDIHAGGHAAHHAKFGRCRELDALRSTASDLRRESPSFAGRTANACLPAVTPGVPPGCTDGRTGSGAWPSVRRRRRSARSAQPGWMSPLTPGQRFPVGRPVVIRQVGGPRASASSRSGPSGDRGPPEPLESSADMPAPGPFPPSISAGWPPAGGLWSGSASIGSES